ncbi:MAG: oligosaccharide flippase family protein [Gammaproteobacteria bacterium]|nr:oligosaccharide flippase family protein [Gammaproteobacteria bacterium]
MNFPPASLWQSVSHLMVGTGAFQVAGVINFILLARLLDESGFGLVRQLVLINQLIFTILFMSLVTAMLYFAGKAADEAERKAVIYTHIRLALMMVVPVCGLLMFAPAGVAMLLNSPGLERLLPVFSLFPLFYIIYTFMPSVLVAAEKTEGLVRFTSVAAVLNMAPVIFVAWFTRDVAAVVATMTLAAGITALLGLRLVALLTRGRSRVAPGARSVFAYAGLLMLSATITIVGRRFDQIAISRELGVELYAIYVVGAFEIPLFSLLQSSVASVLMPKLAAAIAIGDWCKVRCLWRDSIHKSATLMFPLAAWLLIYSEEFITLLFGSPYVTAAPVLSLFCLLVLVRVMNFGLVLRAMGRTVFDLIGAALFTVAVFFGVRYGLHEYGMIGVATAVVASTLLLGGGMVLATFLVSGGELSPRVIYPAGVPIYFFTSLGIIWIMKSGLTAGGAPAWLTFVVGLLVVPTLMLGIGRMSGAWAK